MNKGTIANSRATAYSNNKTDANFAGGFVAVNEGTIRKCYSTGSIKANSNVGGLVGVNNGNVVNSYSRVNVTGVEKVGGLVGENNGKVSYVYASGSVYGEKSIGGLVGENTKNGNVTRAYACGNVTSTKDNWITKEWAGGLVGKNDGSVSNSYRAQTQQLKIEDCECKVGSIVTKSVADKANFYSSLLGFGSSVWNMSNGKLPTLK